MKYKKLMIVGLLLLAILTIGAVSASEDVNSTDALTVETMDEVSVDASDDEIVSQENEQILESSDAEVQSAGNFTTMVPDLEVSVSDVEYGEPAVTDITVVIGPSEGNLLVNLDDEITYTVGFIDYQASCSFENLDVGTHTVTVTYEGQGIWDSATATSSFEVFEAEEEDEDEDDWILDYNTGMISFRELVTLSDRFDSGSLVIIDSRGNVLFRKNVADMEVNHNMKGYKYDQFRGYVVFKEDLNTTETGIYDLTITYYNDENEVVESVNSTVYLDYTSFVTDGEIDITDNNSPLFGFYVFDGMDNGHFEIEIFDGEDTDEDPIKIITKNASTQYIHGTIEFTNEVLELDEGIYTVRVNYSPDGMNPSDHDYYWKYNYFHHEIITIVDNSKFRVRMISESFLDENSQFLVYCPAYSLGSTITIKVTSEGTEYSFNYTVIVNNYELFGFGDLNIYAPGLYKFNIYDENGASLIETYEYEIGNPLSIPDICILGAEGLERTPVVVLYIDKIDNGRIVLADENGVVLFNETLTDDYYHSLGYEEGYYILYSDCNPALNAGDHIFTASYYIDDNYGEHLRVSRTSEIRIVQRNYVVDDDTGIGIELFDYKEHNLDDEEDLIALVSVPGYEQGYLTVVLKDDEDAIRGEFTFDEIDDDDGLPTFFVSLFDRDVDEGDYLVEVTYYDGNDNPVLTSSAWMSFYYRGDEDGPIDEVEFCPPEPEEEFEMGEDVVVAHLYIPEGFDPVTIYVFNGDNLIYTQNTANMEPEWNDIKEANDYPIALDLTQLSNKDIIYFTFDYWGDSVYWAEAVQVEGDKVIFWDDPDFERFEFLTFYGNLTTGDLNNPEMMGPHFEGRSMIITISDLLEIEDGTITVSDGETTFFTKQLSEIDDKYYDFRSLGFEYVIYPGEFSLMSLPEDVAVTFTLAAGDRIISQNRLRQADYVYIELTSDDVGRMFDVEISDNDPFDALNDDDPIVSIVATDDANRQSIYIEIGGGQFHIYVNDEEVEGLGEKILENWIINSGILEEDDEGYLIENGIDPDVYLSLDEDGKISYLLEVKSEDFGYGLQLFRLCSVSQGCRELYLSAQDLGIVESGNYNIKITHISEVPEQDDEEPIDDYIIHKEVLVLEKNVTAIYEPTTSLVADDLVMYKGDGSAWTVTLTDANGDPIANAIVKVGIIGKVYNKRTNADGVASLPINLGVGVYDVNATFEGDDVNAPAFVDATITVNNPPAVLTADDLLMFKGDGSAWTVTLTDSKGNPIANSIVKIGIVGRVYNRMTDADGVASLPINLGVGVYDVNATFEGNDKCSPAFAEATIFVQDQSIAVLTADDLVMYKGDGSAWTVTLTDVYANPIANTIVKIGIVGKVYSKRTNADGVASLPINLGVGVYDVNATFEGDDVRNPAFVSATITVDNARAVLTADDLIMLKGDGSAWTVTLTDSKGNPIANSIVKVGIVGRVYNRMTDADGVASLPINLGVGVYYVNATFDGNDKCGPAFIEANIVVKSPSVSLTADDLVMYKGDGNYWTAVLTDADGLPIANKIVKIGIVGKVYSKRTNEFGVVSLPINLGVGVYDVNATFEDDVYNSAFVNATITVKNPPAILIAEDIVMNHGDGTNYEVTLVDNALNPIKNAIVHITVRGKTYDRRTDENGVARLPINLAVGTYTISASFDGNSKCSEAETNCTVIVN